jgi:hypothetical protein
MLPPIGAGVRPLQFVTGEIELLRVVGLLPSVRSRYLDFGHIEYTARWFENVRGLQIFILLFNVGNHAAAPASAPLPTRAMPAMTVPRMALPPGGRGPCAQWYFGREGPDPIKSPLVEGRIRGRLSNDCEPDRMPHPVRRSIRRRPKNLGILPQAVGPLRERRSADW